MGQVCVPLSASPRPSNGFAFDSLVRRAGPPWGRSEKLTGGAYKSVVLGAGGALRDFASMTVAVEPTTSIPRYGGIWPFLHAGKRHDQEARPWQSVLQQSSRTGRRLNA
jgi:hypothetical protein